MSYEETGQDSSFLGEHHNLCGHFDALSKATDPLFGLGCYRDTVNTAARMESNGQKGRIQCSQATADLLVESGKQGWIKQREDKIHAKGKGELTTYWIEINSLTTSSGTSASYPATVSTQVSTTDITSIAEAQDIHQMAELRRQQLKEYKEILNQLRESQSKHTYSNQTNEQRNYNDSV